MAHQTLCRHEKHLERKSAIAQNKFKEAFLCLANEKDIIKFATHSPKIKLHNFSLFIFLSVDYCITFTFEWIVKNCMNVHLILLTCLRALCKNFQLRAVTKNLNFFYEVSCSFAQLVSCALWGFSSRMCVCKRTSKWTSNYISVAKKSRTEKIELIFNLLFLQKKIKDFERKLQRDEKFGNSLFW
jgi:hypothetical protein